MLSIQVEFFTGWTKKNKKKIRFSHAYTSYISEVHVGKNVDYYSSVYCIKIFFIGL